MESFWIVLWLMQSLAATPVPTLPADVDLLLLSRSAIVARARLLAAPPGPPRGTPGTTRPPPPLVRGTAELSYVSTGGTSSTQTIGSGGELLLAPGPWRLESRTTYLRTSTNREVRARRLTGQVRAARTIGDRAELFARANYLRNTFAGIDNSVDGAAGVTAILIQSLPQRLSLDSGFGYIGEDRTRGPGRYISTLDLGLRHQWEFSRRNRVTNDAQVKTDVDRTSDWRVTHVAALQAELNALLSLKLSHEVNYRNEPVPGFSRSDTVASAAIVATF